MIIGRKRRHSSWNSVSTSQIRYFFLVAARTTVQPAATFQPTPRLRIRRTAVLNVPARFRIAHPAGVAAEEIAQNTSGRQTNGGLEGLAIVPDGSRLYAAMQRPLLQDSQPGEGVKRIVTNSRVIEFDRARGTTREFLYPLDDTANGVSEILAINSHEFLVLERDGRDRTEAMTKKISRIDVERATDITGRETLPAGEIPDGGTTVRTTLFLDLLAPEFRLSGPRFP